MNKTHFFLLPKWALAIGVLFIFVGCSTDIPLSSTPEQSRVSAERFMELARGATGNAALEYRLRAAENLIQANRIEEAGQVFREVQIAEATGNVDLRNKVLEARLALLKEDNSHALSLVRNMLDTVTEGRGTSEAFNPNAIATASASSGKKIALLLPTKGPHAAAAKTIREGFFAAFYKAQQQSSNASSIKVYDTNDGNAVESAYRQAIADNADMIVGPLTKSEVQTIANLSSNASNIPVLALNSIHGKGSRTLFQFGIMPEDEVYAVAEHAKRQGHKRALVIAPQNEWGQRMAKTFTQSWVAQGGQIAGTVILKNADHEAQSAQIQSALQITEITGKAQAGRKQISAGKAGTANEQASSGKNARRQDIDMVFLAASPELGRQIKPLIGFYGSAKLPVYATANIYSGIPAPNKDHDLDGICFCDMPWVLNNTSANNMSANNTYNAGKLANAGQSSGQSPRYFALGLDAYSLAQQLSDARFSSLSSAATLGATGDLRLEGQRFQRRLSCAKFSNGVPHPD